MRPSHGRPHYGYCPSVRVSVCLSVPCGVLTQKEEGAGKPKLVRTFTSAEVSDVPIFERSKGQGHRTPKTSRKGRISHETRLARGNVNVDFQMKFKISK